MRERVRHIIKRNPNEVPLVKQSETAACDINRIMEKYRNGGELQHINKAQGQYGDFSSGLDFTEAYTAIAKAENAFYDLPAHVRDRMGNNPEVFLYKMEDPDFQKEMSDLGVYDQEAGPILTEPKSAAALDPVPTPGGPEIPGETPHSEAKLPQPATKDSSPIQGGE